MSIFVTQAVEQSVRVLVFARPSLFTDDFVQLLHHKHVDIELINPTTITEKELGSLGQERFYKICWLLDDIVKGTADADKVFQFLFGREEPVIIISSSLSQSAVLPWSEKKNGDDQLFRHLKKYLQSSSLVVGVNIIDQEELFVSPFYFFSTAAEATAYIGQTTTSKELVSQALNVLLRPAESSFITVVGENILTPAEKQRLFQASHAQVPKLPPSTTLPNIEVKTQAPRRQKVVEVEYDKTVHQTNISVIPFVQPKIPNRQQSYEQNIRRIKYSHQKQRFLRPVPKKSLDQETAASRSKELQPIEQHLELTIQQLFGSQRQENRETRLHAKAVNTVKTRQRVKRQRVAVKVVMVLVALALLGAGGVGSYIGLRATLFSLIGSRTTTESITDSPLWQKRSTQLLISVLTTEVKVYQFVAGPEVATDTETVLSAVKQLMGAHQQQQHVQELYMQAIAQVLGQKPGSVFNTLNSMSAQQQSLYSSLSVVQTQLQSLPTEFLSDKDGVAIEGMSSEIQAYRKKFAIFEQVKQLLPAFLAQDSRRRIAIVVQDSAELRPSGGVVQGVYLFTVEKGQVIDQQFYDVTQLAAQQKGTIQAPTDFQKYFNRKELSILDAGWGPDFTETANTIATFLDQTIGRKPDIVLTMTTQTAQKILAQLGDIKVASTNEVLSSKSLYERLEFHPEGNYFREVFQQIIEQALKSPDRAAKLLSIVGEELQDGQAFIVSNDQTENDVLNSLGWAGQVSTPQCPTLLGTDKCQVQTIYQVESNVGVNKVNPLIRRSIRHTLTIGPKTVSHQRVMTFKNQANTSRWPLGIYRNYLRLYLPNEAKLSGIRVGQKDLDLSTLDRGVTKSGQFIGFLVEVPPQATVSVVAEYQQDYASGSGTGIAFFDQKQPGTPPDEYVLTLVLEGLQPSIIAPKASLQNGKVVFAEPREKHEFVGIKFR